MNDLLRQPDAAIKAVQSERLREMLDLCARGHAFYQRLWASTGIGAAQVRSTDNIALLPLTSKQDLMQEPEAFRLRVPDLPLEERSLWEVIHTTGSTADPVPIYTTTHDYHAYLFQAKRVAEISGITDRDVIANLFPLTPAPMGAFLRSSANAFAVGAAVVAGLPGAPFGRFGIQRPLDEAVRIVERHRATLLWGVTSFVRRLLMRAAELQADFSHVRMCAVTGEASSPAMREDIRRRMRALNTAGTTVFDRYGSTEMGGLAQCREDGDWHNPAPEILYLEAVDTETGQPVPEGERGALAITHLDRRGTVLLRFLVGDVVSVSRAPCPHCGRMGERVVGPVVRTKDLIKVKGMLINPALLLETLPAVEGIEEFQVVVRRQDPNDALSMDELVVRVAPETQDTVTLADQVASVTAKTVGVRPKVELVRATDIHDPGGRAKLQRFVDMR
jgi:phenylacetate-coenzyme A ligase PaaK-like adenylate-forming protein